MEIKKTHPAFCHCKEIEFEIYLPNGLEDLKRCNCSFCRMRGAVMAMTQQKNIRFLKGVEKLTLYQFNTMTAKHYFCSVCGIYTHHQRRSNPDQFGFNVACLEGVNPYELGDIPISNGINHLGDQKR